MSQIPKGYKQTDVGVIPEEWEVKTVGEVSEVKTGPFGSSLHERDYVAVGTPIITVEHLGERGVCHLNLPMVSDTDRIRLKAYSLRKGDLVFSRVGSVDRNALIRTEEDGWLFSGRLLRVRLKRKDIDSQYLSFHFHSENFKQRVKDVAVGQTMASINTKILMGVSAVFPSTKTEQEAIAGVLSDADALISALERLIDKKQNLKLAAMQHLLTPKPDWEVKKLGEIANVVGGGTPSTFATRYWNGDVNWFTPTEVGRCKYVFESMRKITKEGLVNCSAKILPIGTILLTSRAGIGDVGILKREACTNQGFQSLVPNENCDSEYLYYLMLTLKEVLLKNASGSTFLEISPNKIKQIEISIPPHAEQAHIAAILSDMDEEIGALESKLSKQRQIKEAMMSELLTGGIRLV